MRRVAPVLLALLALPVAAADERPVPELIAGCAERLQGDPTGREVGGCISAGTRTRSRRLEAAPLVAALVTAHPERPWLRVAWSWTLQSSDLDRALGVMAEADAAFAAAGDIPARIDLLFRRYEMLNQFGRNAEAAATLDALLELTARSGTPQQLAYARVRQAGFLHARAEDMGAAWDIARQIEREQLDLLTSNQQADLYATLATVATDLLRYRDALRYRMLQRDHCNGARDVTCTVRSDLGTINALEGLASAGGMAPGELAAAVDDVARRLQDDPQPTNRVAALCTLARFYPPPEAVERMDRCISEALQHGCADLALPSLVRMAVAAAGGDPVMARRLLAQLDRVGQVAAGSSTNFDWWRMASARASLAVEAPERAAARGWRMLDTMDRYRERQSGDDAAARAGESVSIFYYAFADFLRRGPGRLTDPDPLSAALRVIERLRGRALQFAPRAAPPGAGGAGPVGAARTAHQDLLERIAATQKSLAERPLEEAERRRALDALDALEDAETVSRAELARLDPDRVAWDPSRIPDVASVCRRIAPDEALISYQVSPFDGTHPWAAVLTRAGASEFELPDSAWLTGAAFIAGGDADAPGNPSPAMATLAARVLSPALGRLGPQVSRLILILDGPLHDVRFEALPIGNAEGLVLDRYTVETTTSITAWYESRGAAAHRRPADDGAELVIAAPRLIRADSRGVTTERGKPYGTGEPPGALPQALREGREVAALLGPETSLLVGDAASEAAVKALAGRPLRWLHFATHAVADEQHPERSAILLAAGSPDEDGLLQPRDLDALDLHGTVVVLSACRSAVGTRYLGQGVTSLARAFLARGAAAVVGTTDAIRDDDARDLMTAFYRNVRAGRPLAEALAAAKRELRAHGGRQASWTSPILVGDGRTVLEWRAHAPPPRGWRFAVWTSFIGGSSLALALWLALRRRRGTRSISASADPS